MKTKVYTYPHGDKVAIVIPAPGFTIEDAINHPDVPSNSGLVVDAEDLPDRYFRDAWEFDPAKGAKINIEKAKEVQRNLWRKMREPKLAALDIEFMQAVEEASPAKRNTIRDKKIALRDVTLTELTDDPEAIKNTIPKILI